MPAQHMNMCICDCLCYNHMHITEHAACRYIHVQGFNDMQTGRQGTRKGPPSS